jgi:hypothetical protein
MKRRNLLWAVTGGLVATALAGGIAYATIPGTGSVYTACMLKNVGTVRLIDKSLPDANPMSHCSRTLELEVSWNQRGQDGVSGTNGTNGRDVTATFEPPGSNCAGGGAQLSAANGISYLCNGKDGRDGTDGRNGTNGTDGHDGVDVAGAPEPAGTNCANGGSKFTSVSGVTYACNGSDSVTLTTEAAGANCAYGGVKLTTGGDEAYVCNGAPGAQGPPGHFPNSSCIDPFRPQLFYFVTGFFGGSPVCGSHT